MELNHFFFLKERGNLICIFQRFILADNIGNRYAFILPGIQGIVLVTVNHLPSTDGCSTKMLKVGCMNGLRVGQSIKHLTVLIILLRVKFYDFLNCYHIELGVRGSTRDMLNVSDVFCKISWLLCSLEIVL